MCVSLSSCLFVNLDRWECDWSHSILLSFVLFYLPFLLTFPYCTGMLLLFVLMGAFAGFTSARLYKTFKGNFHIPIIVYLFPLFQLLSSLVEVVVLCQYFIQSFSFFSVYFFCISILFFFVLPYNNSFLLIFSSMSGKQWQRCTLLTATLFPGIVFSVFLALDLLVWSYGSTGAVPFGRWVSGRRSQVQEWG